jgi:hypothetical protein
MLRFCLADIFRHRFVRCEFKDRFRFETWVYSSRSIPYRFGLMIELVHALSGRVPLEREMRSILVELRFPDVENSRSSVSLARR